MPKNLIIIIIFQIVFLIPVLVFAKYKNGSADINWLPAIGIGIVIGAFMDVILGGYDLFAYLLNGANAVPLEPIKLPSYILIFNIVVSYGISAITLAFYVTGFSFSKSRLNSWWIVIGLFMLLGVLGIIYFPLGSLSVMVAWGLAIISASELAIYIFGKNGFIMMCLIDRNARPLLGFWGFCLYIGIAYELVNLRFPFWNWLPDSSFNPNILAALIAFFGYLVLFYPMATLYILFRDIKR